jgi:hypothetical protein
MANSIGVTEAGHGNTSAPVARRCQIQLTQARRGDIAWAPPVQLPDDGKLVEDERSSACAQETEQRRGLT